MTRGRAALAGGALIVLIAGCVLAAHALLYTTVPHGLHLSGLSARKYFTSVELHDGAAGARFIDLMSLLSQLALIAGLAVFARFGARLQRESAAGRIGTGIMLALLGFAIAGFAQLPFEIAQLAWLRAHHILHESYLTLIFGHWFSLGGRAIFVSAAVAIVMGLARPLRRAWWLAAAPLFAALMLLFTFVGPYLVPGTHALRDQVLAAQTRALERRDGLPTDIRVRVLSVHGETTEPNSAAAGIGPSRTVLVWDTLLDGRFSPAEVRTVMAHELGHQKRGHIPKEVGWFALFSLVIAGGVALATRRRGGMFEPRAVPVALLVYVTLQFIATPLHNAITRRYEREADWIALRSARAPATQRAMLIKLAVLTQSDPDPPTWEYVLFDDHPTFAQRIALTNAWHGE